MFAFDIVITITITVIFIIIVIISIILLQAWLEDRFRQVQRLTCSRIQVGFQIDPRHFWKLQNVTTVTSVTLVKGWIVDISVCTTAQVPALWRPGEGGGMAVPRVSDG